MAIGKLSEAVAEIEKFHDMIDDIEIAARPARRPPASLIDPERE